jgi:lincosamide nucleotidyltransferase A/C/D/E
MPGVVDATDALALLDRLDAAGVWHCVEGGWGVDALLGEQTRPHDDLDLGVRMDEVERICAAFPEFRRDDVEWPASFVLRDGRGRSLDCHPLDFEAEGDGLQARLGGGFSRWPRRHLGAHGLIAGRDVRCITPELQLRWHAYDGLDDVDWEDMQRLCRRFGLPVPPHLAARPGFRSDKRAPIR